MNKLFVSIAAVVLLVVVVAVGVQVNQANSATQATTGDPKEDCTSCDMHGKETATATAAQNEDAGDYYGKVDANGKASGTSLMAAYKAETLYTCPMHPEIVTDNPNAGCPTCGMNLTQMSEEDVTALKESKPRGCMMHPIVVAGDSETDNCSICNMKLMDPSDAHGGGGMHGGSHGGAMGSMHGNGTN